MIRRDRPAYDAAGFVVAVVVAVGLAAFGVVRGTWAVGGSDSSCYGLMAQAFSHGRLQPSSALAVDAPWPNAAITFAPGGFVPSAIRPDSAAPICAPGMSVLMAPLAVAFGQDAIFWLTPIAAALLVLSAYVLARQLAGGMAGATAAILTATSPIVLYQTVQPMNDIVTAALWLAALAALRWHLLSGILTGLAILVRPNLAPLALVVVALQVGGPAGRQAGSARSLLIWIAGALPGVAVMLWLNQALYGSVIGSGYGPIGNLFSLAHVSQNLTNYGTSIWQTQYALPLLGVFAPVVFEGEKRRVSVALLAAALLVAGIYLLYQPFPEWWYLRFLIPVIVILIALTSAVAVSVLARANMGGVIPIAAVVIGVLGTRTAGELKAFELQRMEGRYRQTAELVRDRLPANAVLITEWESGGMRFHAGHEVVLWQSLDPAWLDRAVTWLRSKGLQPYVLVERREEAEFRARFRAASEAGGLDWPPRFDVNRQVRIFDPLDRARYLAGEQYPTENFPSRQGVGRRVR